jgi:predicted transposase YbfD/YdcC
MDSSIEGCEVIADVVDAPLRPARAQLQGIYHTLQTLTDGRHKRGVRYELAAVLTVILLAKCAGEHTGLGIAEWVRLRIEWLKELLPLQAGPCANTYRYICEKVDIAELQTTVTAYLAAAAAAPAATALATPAPLRHLACDGKELRGSRRVGGAIQQVMGIYDVTAQRMQALLPIAGKGYEPVALKQWLDAQPAHQLDNCLVTADALHTRAVVCEAICCRGGDYLLFVKANQPTLHEHIRVLFSQPPNRLQPEQSAKTVDNRHGRLEVRTLRTSTELNAYLGTHWPDVAQVFQIERCITRTHQGVTKTTTQSALCITSLSPARASPKQLLHHTRAHWQIENRSHWRRDATLHEDATKLSSKAAAMVMAILNNTILAILDQQGVGNVRRAMRRFAAHPEEALSLIISPA